MYKIYMNNSSVWNNSSSIKWMPRNANTNISLLDDRKCHRLAENRGYCRYIKLTPCINKLNVQLAIKWHTKNLYPFICKFRINENKVVLCNFNYMAKFVSSECLFIKKIIPFHNENVWKSDHMNLKKNIGCVWR